VRLGHDALMLVLPHEAVMDLMQRVVGIDDHNPLRSILLRLLMPSHGSSSVDGTTL
jgi:hypothetical protein